MLVVSFMNTTGTMETGQMMDHQTTPTEVAARRHSVARIGLLGAVAAAVVAAAILIIGATAAPWGTLAAASGTDGLSAGISDLQGRGPGGGFTGGPGGPRDERGFREITITAITGSNIALETTDGWTRTISLASDTVLMKGDARITLSDLKVGDQVRIRQTRQDDGSFKVTELHVVLPHAGGKVSAVSGFSITVTHRDGSTGTINVTSATTYEVGRTEGKALSDITVGMLAGAIGTLNADGSLTASVVHAIDPASMPDFGGPGEPGGHGPRGNGSARDASPDASADSSAG